MTTKAYLTQLKTIDIEIAMAESDGQSWIDLATKMTHEMSDIRVNTSPRPDKMESLVVKAADCALDAKKEKEMLLYKKRTIENQIKSVEDSRFKCILWNYYHDKRSIKEIAKILNLSEDRVGRQMAKAVRVFEDKWGHTYLSQL